MLASVVLNRASKTLLDDSGVTWTPSELLDYLNAGINAIVMLKPDVSVTTGNITLTSGTPKQTLPVGGLQLLDVIRNAGSPYTAIRQIERNHLNHTDPDWANTTGSAIKHYMYDRRNPKVFWVYPTPSSGISIEAVYSVVPTRLTAASDSITIDDIYETALWYFVLAGAYAKNAKRGDAAKMNNYLQMFANQLGMREQIQFNFSPMTPDESPSGKGQRQGPTE